MGVKRDKYDAIVSDLARARNDYTCEHCGIFIPEGNRQAAHCAHIHSRKSQSVRYDPDNVLCLCAKCHYWFSDHPTDFSGWLNEYIGEGRLEILREKMLRIKKWEKGEKDEMLKYYREELKKIRAQRDEGQTGRIDFVGWE